MSSYYIPVKHSHGGGFLGIENHQEKVSENET